MNCYHEPYFCMWYLSLHDHENVTVTTHGLLSCSGCFIGWVTALSLCPVYLTCGNEEDIACIFCSSCFLHPHLGFSSLPHLSGRRLTQLSLISLVSHNSWLSVSLCPVNEDADVIGLPTPPRFFVYCWHFRPLPARPPSTQARVQCCCCIFLRSCITVQQSSRVAGSISIFPGRHGHCGKQWPRNWPSFQYSRKTLHSPSSARVSEEVHFDLCRGTMKRHHLRHSSTRTCNPFRLLFSKPSSVSFHAEGV